MLRHQHGMRRVDIRPNMDRLCVRMRVRHILGVHLSEYFDGRDGLIPSCLVCLMTILAGFTHDF
jgi:hypothetical protein